MKQLLTGLSPRQEEFERFFYDVEASELYDEVFEQLFATFDKTKNPGSPINFRAQNNGGINMFLDEFKTHLRERLHNLESLGDSLYDIFLHDPSRFEEVLGYGMSIEEASTTAAYLVENNFDDPVLLKVKGEARPVGKRPRLVCMVSSLQTAVWRLVLFNAMQREQDETDGNIAVRLDIITESETRKLFEKFFEAADEFGFLSSSDVQGWEYANNVDTHYAPLLKWAYYMGLTDLDFKLLPGASRRHLNTLLALYYTSCFRVLQTEDGELLTCPLGKISSGALTTFTDNSLKRNLLSNEVSYRAFGKPVAFTFSAGDDNLDSNPDLSSVYREYGFVITDYEQQTKTFSFCSTNLTPTGCWQDGLEKFVANLLFTGTDFDIQAASLPVYVHHPDFLSLSKVLYENWRVPFVL